VLVRHTTQVAPPPQLTLQQELSKPFVESLLTFDNCLQNPSRREFNVSVQWNMTP
jgi:hypothetical protein